jgi:parallel beta-helix repeat protein
MIQGDSEYDNNDGVNATNLSNVTIENINVESFYWGIQLFNCSNCHVSKNNATGNLVGITVSLSSYVIISGNNVLTNGFVGIEVGDYSNDNIIVANNAVQNGLLTQSISITSVPGGGIFVELYSDNNTVKENTIANDANGMYLAGATNTKIYHNNFENNTVQVYTGSYGNGSNTVWNNPYPSGGNYWSDYLTRYPNASEIDNSGIWNTPYVIGTNNTDYYPLMKLWQPLSVVISPSSAIIDLGQSQNFTSNVSGGTSPYTYQWYLNGVAVSGANISSSIYEPIKVGLFTVFVKVTDNTGLQATSNVVNVKVNEALFVTVLPSSAMDVDQSETLNSTVYGGTSPYAYQWYLNSVAVPGATTSTWNYLPTSTGSSMIYLKVTDSAAPRANIVASNNITVTINAAPSVKISPNSTTMDIGQPKTFTLIVAGGASPYKYQWYVNGTPVSGATSSSWVFTPTSSGSYMVYANATDNVGLRAKSNIASVTVNPRISVIISPKSFTLDFGQSQTFTATVAGGTPQYSYHWYLNNILIQGAGGPTCIYNASISGSKTVYVNVTDDAGDSADSSTSSGTVKTVLLVSITPATVSSDLGQSQTFKSTVSGGTSPYSYQWYYNGSLIPDATSSSWTFTPALGSYTIYVKIKDYAGMWTTSNITLATVNQALAVTVLPSVTTLDVGQSETFTATVNTGTLPYSYQWYLNGTAVSSAIDSSWTFKPSNSASYTVYVKVTDAAGAISTSNIASVTFNTPSSANLIIAIIIAIIAAFIVVASVATLKRRKHTLNPHEP